LYRQPVYRCALDPVQGSELGKTRVRVIDKSRLGSDPIATLDSATMAEVDAALRVSLGLR